MQKFRLSPTLFLVLEIIFLSPSLLFVLSILVWYTAKNPYLYAELVSPNFWQNALSLVVSPIAGGFLAYQYLERYKAKGKQARLAKIILAYAIIEAGLITIFFLAGLIKSH